MSPSLPCPRVLYLLLLPLIYLLLQPPQEPVLPTQLGQQSLEKGGQELLMDQTWLFALPTLPPSPSPPTSILEQNQGSGEVSTHTQPWAQAQPCESQGREAS